MTSDEIKSETLSRGAWLLSLTKQSQKARFPLTAAYHTLHPSGFA